MFKHGKHPDLKMGDFKLNKFSGLEQVHRFSTWVQVHLKSSSTSTGFREMYLSTTQVHCKCTFADVCRRQILTTKVEQYGGRL